VVVSLPCTNLGSAAKRIKESDLVVTQPNKFVRRFFNKKTTIYYYYMIWNIAISTIKYRDKLEIARTSDLHLLLYMKLWSKSVYSAYLKIWGQFSYALFWSLFSNMRHILALVIFIYDLAERYAKQNLHVKLRRSQDWIWIFIY